MNKKHWFQFRVNITAKFILYMAGVSVIPLLALGILAYTAAFSIIKDQVYRYTTELVRDRRDYLDVLLQEVESLIANVSGVEEITNNVLSGQDTPNNTYTDLATQARIGYILNNYINVKGLVSIDIYTSSGTHYHVGDTLQANNLNEQTRDNIFAAARLAGGDILWTGVEDNINIDSTYKKVITAAKVFNQTDTQTGETKALALMVVNYNIYSLHDHFFQTQLGEGAYMMVVDTQNRIIYHPNSDLIGSKVNASFMEKLSGPDGNLTTDINGNSMIVTYTLSESSHWKVASFVPVRNLTAQTIPIATTTIVVLCISFLVVFALTIFYNRSLVSPIRQITSTFKQYKEGQLDLSTRLKSTSADEIGELVTWLNDFLETQVEKQRAEEALRARERYLTLLNEITLVALGTPDLDRMLMSVTSRLSELFMVDRCNIILLNPVHPELAPISYGPEGRVYQTPPTGPFLPALIATNRPVFIADTSNSVYIKDSAHYGLENCALLAFPLQSADQKLGIALIISNSARTFSEEEIASGEQAARQISLAVAKTNLLEEIEQRAHVFENLFETARDLANLNTTPELLHSMITHTIDLLGNTAGFIYLYDKNRGDLELADCVGADWEIGTRLAIGEGLAGQVMLTRQPILVNDYQNWQHRSEKFSNRDIGCAAAVPMIWGDTLIGLLGVEREQADHTQFTESDMRVLSLVARLGTSSINNTLLLHELRRFNEQLEDRVASRTAQLAKINLELENEINERKEIEHTLMHERASLAQRVTERTAELSDANASLAQAVRTKDEFLANMSHEIRTPINGVIGMTGLILGTQLTVEQRRYANTIRLSAESLLSVINDILDFSKIEAGKLDIFTQNFDLPELIHEIGDIFDLRAYEKGLEWVCDISPEVPDLVHGDSMRIKQVLNNLVSNAIKFTDQGEVVLSVTLQSLEKDVAEVKFSIRDTGIGIPKDKIGALFQAFTQVDASTTKKYGGTGLGLSISKKLVDLMGGQIGVQSDDSVGSDFWFMVPFKIPASPAPFKPATAQNLKVLVVEDNATHRQVLTNRLNEYGFTASSASEIRLAVRMLQAAVEEQAAFQLVIMDNTLPGGSGVDLARAIGASRLRPAPRLILMSSGRGTLDTQILKAAGIAGVLPKPVKIRQLTQTLEAIYLDDGSGPVLWSTPDPGIALFEPAAYPTLANLQVLLVEDNPINQDVAMTILRKSGIAARATANGLEAVAVLETMQFDLILMDMQMPEMDGLQATRYIRAETSPVLNHHVPIIAMTANAMRKDQEACLEAGMNDYISKPFNPIQLIEKLVYWTAPERLGAGQPPREPLPTIAPAAAPVAAAAPAVLDSSLPLAAAPESPAALPEELAALPVIQFDELYNRLMGDHELAASLLQKLAGQLQKNLGELGLAYENRDPARIKQLAHKLKGSAGNLSAEPLRLALENLEQAGAAAEWAVLPDLLSAVQARAAEFCALVQQG